MPTPRHTFRNHIFSFNEGDLAPHENLMTCIIIGRRQPVAVSNDQCSLDADMVCIKPGVPHRVTVRRGGAEIIYLDGVQLAGSKPPFDALPPGWRDLPHAFDAEDHARIAQFRHALDERKHPPDQSVMQVVGRIYDQPFLRLSQRDLATWLNLERTQALRHFKATTGQTFRKFKTWAAIVAAARIAHGGEKIGLAGIETGFSDAAHLARTASTVFGTTPSKGLSSLTRVLTVHEASRR